MAHPDWVLAKRQKGTAIHKIKGNYYLYEVYSKWDPIKKRPVRHTGKSLGRIRPDGVFTSDESKQKRSVQVYERQKLVSVKEYGVCHFIQTHLDSYLKKLQKHFPEQYDLLIILAYCRLLHQSSIRQMPLHAASSYWSEVFSKLTVSEKQISLFLRDIGRQRNLVTAFMQEAVGAGDHILVDMTNIPSKSENIRLARPGYNSDWTFEPQFNLMYVYSNSLKMPIFYRLVPGNIKEVTAMTLTMRESGVKHAVMIADKGFYSNANIEQLEADEMQYIVPLRRDNNLIDYPLTNEQAIKNGANYFFFEKRYIWYASYKIPDTHRTVYLFLDDSLKVKEQSDFLSRVESNLDGYTIEKFHAKKHAFGTIAMITNLESKQPQEIYTAYKTRQSIEVVFDALKTVLEADRTYMQQEEVLQGWMFVNHIALQWYYHLYNMLVRLELNGKYSVNDLLDHLQNIRMVKMEGKWHRSEAVKATQKLLDKISKPIA